MPGTAVPDHFDHDPNAMVVTDGRPSPSKDELVLLPDHVIRVVIDGIPLKLLVTADASGPVAVNPAVAVNLKWRATAEMLWDYGDGEPLRSGVMWQRLDFGDRSVTRPVMWSFGRATPLADGMIGIHQLPYKRVVLPLSAPIGQQTVQRFQLKRFGSQQAQRIGTDLDADGRKLKAIFAANYVDNIITAPMANYLASRFGGGFLPASEGVLTMRFGVQRRTRIMQLARPLQLGDLLVDRFAVRLEDYGKARHVGEAGTNDPRFDPNEIVVSDRKPRGRVDFLTRIGRGQIAHCSALTYDFDREEIILTCGPPPE
ncbi:MAG: hypothetical protein EDM03_08600 [Porphyrobacter sp. IPPAS B-1204]|nr:MAG: hypothetical protein EDM03_08600 [Porphyrobacter sp. IPPAS B-1204]